MTTALFSDIEKTLLANIKKTASNVKIAVAWFTNPKLYDVLYDLVNAGKTVELILADDVINFTNKKLCFQSLIDKGVEIRISRFPNLMHHKFCLIDERLLISGSYNWTVSAEVNNHENAILSNELNLVSQFNAEFDSLKKATEQLTLISTAQLNSYFSKKETAEEAQLLTITTAPRENTDNPEQEKVQSNEVSEEIEQLLGKADLFYLQGKHQSAIDLCLEIIGKQTDLAEAFELIAASKWRQKKYKEQIEFAQKAVGLDNKYYPAYNTLAIGYAHIRNAQKSIENYQVCITAEPEQYVYYRNRAVSFRELETDPSIPKSLRNQFTKKANADLIKVIELTNKLEPTDNSYKLYFSRGVANLILNKLHQAKFDLLKAKELYEKSDKMEQDIHEYREIKQALNDIERIQKQ
jgi:hypothetical protein